MPLLTLHSLTCGASDDARIGLVPTVVRRVERTEVRRVGPTVVRTVEPRSGYLIV